MISVISGYEIAVVALAVIALLVMLVSALVGIATRMFRSAPTEEDRRGLRRRRSPGRSS